MFYCWLNYCHQTDNILRLNSVVVCSRHSLPRIERKPLTRSVFTLTNHHYSTAYSFVFILHRYLPTFWTTFQQTLTNNGIILVVTWTLFYSYANMPTQIFYALFPILIGVRIKITYNIAPIKLHSSIIGISMSQRWIVCPMLTDLDS